jgi:hypothetical protein
MSKDTSQSYLLEFTMSIGAFVSALFEYKYAAVAFICFTISMMFYRLQARGRRC